MGVAVPPFAIVDSPADADAFGRTHGYPIVVKRAHGFAGAGVAICASADDVAHAFHRFSEPQALDFGDSLSRLLVQAHVPGSVQYYLSTAWQGRLIAGYASEKIVANPHPTGPPTVTRHFRSPQLRVDCGIARGRLRNQRPLFRRVHRSDRNRSAARAGDQPADHARKPPGQPAQRRSLGSAARCAHRHPIAVAKRLRRRRGRSRRVVSRRMAARPREPIPARARRRRAVGRARVVRRVRRDAQRRLIAGNL